MDELTIKCWLEIGLPILKPPLICYVGENMTELQKKLQDYVELKKFIEEYNTEQFQKGLDLAVRIMQDLVIKYPNQLGEMHIKWGDDWYKEELVLKIGKLFENNSNFLSENKQVKEYILNRYPDAESHYNGIKVATCISKRNIDKFVKGELE